MLVNQNKSHTTSHVEFVSYNGKYPNLCSGILVLRINGKEVKFGSKLKDDTVQHCRFWSSGGRCSIGDIEEGPWRIDVLSLPKKYRKYADEIDRVFNANIEHGCCGGCR